MKRYFLSLILFVVLVSFSPSYSQTFTTVPFITIPGDNTDVDLLGGTSFSSSEKSFICWVNHTNSIYTLYIRQISPDEKKNIIVFSDSVQIANPNVDITLKSYNNNVRIAWQSYINNHWQILYRDYLNDSLTSIVSVTDSLTDNTNPQLNMTSIFWIQDGKLIYKSLDSANVKSWTLDSLNCSNPKVDKLSYNYPDLLYEKGPEGNKQIIKAYYKFIYPSSYEWSFNQISTSGNNINPGLNTIDVFSYQEYENGIWKVVYSLYRTDTTDNNSYNCENPVSFAYPRLTKKSTETTPFFVVYDSDSLKNNKEIILKTEIYSDITMNISNAEGDDYLPNISFYKPNDTTYVAIFWIHDQNGKKDIWMAYSKYNPNLGAVENSGITSNNFVLNQNYPNPFNPSTLISWNLVKSSPVTLKVYDILGNEVATLVNEFQSAGEHSITFDTQKNINSRLSSGIYFYQLKAGSFIQTKKMLYLK